MSKFYKGERVRFSPNMNYFVPTLSGSMSEMEAVITKVKGDTYQIKGFVGFWPEHFFRKVEPQELKDTEAEWIKDYDVGLDVVFTCSNCGYSALNDWRGNSTDSKFCPHCGKRMINSTMSED